MLRTLTHKVTFGVATFMVVLLIVTIFAVTAALETTAFSNYLTGHTLAFTHSSGQLLVNTAQAMTEIESFVRSNAPSEREEALERLDEAQEELNTLRTLEVRNNRTLITEAEHTMLLDRWQALLNQTTQHVQTIITAVDQGNQQELTTAFDQLELLEDQFEPLESETEALIQSDTNAAVAALAEQNQRRLISAPLGLGTLASIALLTVWLLRRFVIRPIVLLSQTARMVAQGDLNQQVAVTANDEIGDLQQTFNHMLTSLRAQQAALEQRNTELLNSMNAQQQLVTTVRQLSAPLLPVLSGVVVLPLVGHVDTQRAEAITQTLLRGVAAQHARTVILDLTGIAAIDTHVIRLLFKAKQATELLGAQVWLVGINAALAQAMVAQGFDTGQLRTYRDVGSALRRELQAVETPDP